MSESNAIYICPVCFDTSEIKQVCHQHMMLRCDPGEVGTDARKPLVDAQGNLATRAPRWFLEARNRLREKGFYICRVCFRVSEHQEECHDQMMLCCDLSQTTEEQRKPDVTHEGQVVSRAPRWFKEAVTRLSSE